MDVAKLAAKYDPAAAFRQLQDPDPTTRLLGAKWLSKHAHGEVHDFTEPWLRDKGTMDRLLPHLADSDPLVVEYVLGAVNVIVARYRRDDRTVLRAIQLLVSDRPNTRIRAAMLLTNFDDEALADPLLALFADPDKAVRFAVVSEVARPALQWSAATQERVRLAALERLLDRTVDVRCAAASLLISVGRADDVETLRTGLKAIKGANWRQEYRESLTMLEDRLRANR